MNLDKRLLQLARRSGWALALTIGLGFAAGVFTVIQAGAFSRLVRLVFLDGQGRAEVRGLLALLLGVIGLRALLAWGSEISANAIARRIKIITRAALYRRLLERGPAYLTGQNAGELANTLLDGVEALDAYFSQYLPGLALAALTPLTFLVVVFPLDWVSGLALLLTAPLIPLFMILIGSAAQALTRRQFGALSRMSAYFLDVLQGLATLKLLGRSRAQVDVMAQVSERFRVVTMAVLRVTFLSALALEMLATLSTAVVAVQVGLRLLYGRLEFEQAFFVLLLAPEFYLPLRLLGTRFHAGMSGVAAAQRIFKILEASPTPAAAQPAAGAAPAPHTPPAIRFEGVHFTYSADAPPGEPAETFPAAIPPAALNGLDLEIAAGSRTALVGPSGAGKSTVAALLLGFIAPAQGVIMVDGRPLDALDLPAWRERLAWLPQRPYLFHDTVLANLRLARPDASQDAIVEAARQAEAHEFIQALPQGYETVIGEGGARLSGGQAQRLALARAFLRDAPFIILDEPTASMDPAGEAALQASLERLLCGRTALIIAHRLNTVRAAERIVVLDGGRAVAAGTHTELLAQGGLYRRLVETYTGVTPAAGSAPDLADAPPAARSVALDPGAPARGFSTVLPAIAPGGETAAPGERLSGRVFLRLLGFLLPYWKWALLAALAGAATVLSGVGLMGASTYIICAAALHPSVAELQVAIVGVRFFGISRGLFRYLERLLSHETTFRLLARLRVWFYAALEPLAPARLSGLHSGDLLARILGDIESLENFYVRVAAPPLTALLSGAVVWFLLARFDVGIALAWLACWLAAGVGLPLLARWLGRAPGRESVQRRAELSTALVAGVQGLPDLLAFDRGQDWLERLNALSERLAASQRRSAWVTGLQTAAGSGLSNVSLWLTAFLAIPLVRAGQMDGVYLAVAALIAQTGFEAVLPLPAAAQFLEANLQSARRLFDVVDARPAVVDPPMPLPVPAAADLRVRGLSFQYSDLSVVDGGKALPPSTIDNIVQVEGNVLQDISFDLPPGARLAIVGPSGAGKSTIISLLARFYEYEQGEILLGGEDLRRCRQDDVRRMLAVLPQRAYLFSASLADNLLLANPKASAERLEQAARLAGLHDWIATLPQGYATWAGEGGVRLSGGQRQRLALARLLLCDAPIVLLDEPTAGLDAISERAALAAIFAALQGRSVLWVTHRLVDMERMDEILVLDRGRIVQRGTHAALVEAQGVYRRLWEIQKRGGQK